jgi:ribosomal protein S18 acetylase RimI-like enzyme
VSQATDDCIIRPARPGDEPGAYHVCLKTGNYGQDGELYTARSRCLGPVFAGPYLAYEAELSLILEDALDLRIRVGCSTRGNLRALRSRVAAGAVRPLPAPTGDSSQWTRAQQVHHGYHHPDYFCPEPYELYPAHLHIDLLVRAQGRGYGRRMLEQVMDRLRRRGSPGAHLGVSMLNMPAFGFYQRLGFLELVRVGAGTEGCIYMGKRL